MGQMGWQRRRSAALGIFLGSGYQLGRQMKRQLAGVAGEFDDPCVQSQDFTAAGVADLHSGWGSRRSAIAVGLAEVDAAASWWISIAAPTPHPFALKRLNCLGNGLDLIERVNGR
ncbi:hypothetical protein ACFX13_033382 [Malus domestica]